jgi:hypothetical protein
MSKQEIKLFIDLWKLIAKHVVQLAVLERVAGCRYTEDSQICVLLEQYSGAGDDTFLNTIHRLFVNAAKRRGSHTKCGVGRCRGLSPPSVRVRSSSTVRKGLVTNANIPQDIEVNSDIYMANTFSDGGDGSEDSGHDEDSGGPGLSTQEKLQAIADLLKQGLYNIMDAKHLLTRWSILLL